MGLVWTELPDRKDFGKNDQAYIAWFTFTRDEEIPETIPNILWVFFVHQECSSPIYEDSKSVSRGDSVKTEERMGVFVVSEDLSEVRTGGWQDQLVGWHHLLVITHQGHIEELLLRPQQTEGPGHVGLEIIPLQTELLRHLVDLRLDYLPWKPLYNWGTKMISNISLNSQSIFTFVDQKENSDNNLAKDIRKIQKNLFIFSSYQDKTSEKLLFLKILL